MEIYNVHKMSKAKSRRWLGGDAVWSGRLNVQQVGETDLQCHVIHSALYLCACAFSMPYMYGTVNQFNRLPMCTTSTLSELRCWRFCWWNLQTMRAKTSLYFLPQKIIRWLFRRQEHI